MPRGRHRQSSPLSRLLPPTACGVLAIASLISAVFTADPVVLRTLVVAASVGAFAGAVLLRLRDHAGEIDLEAEIAARSRDEARFEERAAELEAQAESAEEQVKRLERRLLAQRAQITRIESENSRLLRDRARAAAEQAAREADETRRGESVARGTRPTPTAYLKAAAALRGMERRAAVGQAQRIAAQASAPHAAGVPRPSTQWPAATGAGSAGTEAAGVAPLPSALDALAAATARQHPGQEGPAASAAAATAAPATATAASTTAATGASAADASSAATAPGAAAAVAASTVGAAAATAPVAATSVPAAGSAASAGSHARSAGVAPQAAPEAGPQAAPAVLPQPQAAPAPAWARAALPPMRPASAVLPNALIRPARQSRDLLRKDAGSSGTFNFFSRQEAAISRDLGDLADVVGDEAAAAQQLYAGDPVAAEAAVGGLPDPEHYRTDETSEGGIPGPADGASDPGVVDLTADDETEPIDVRALRAI